MSLDESKKNICDDRPIEIPEYIKKMTDKEIAEEFEKRFGRYLKEENQKQK